MIDQGICGENPTFCLHLCEDGSITGFGIFDYDVLCDEDNENGE